MSTMHFTDAELGCKHCGELPPDEFQHQLERLRWAWNRPLIVSSAYRCADHNQVVSTTGPRGPHTRGAVDLRIPAELVYEFVHVAMLLGWRGIGIHQHGPRSQRFIHLDRLPERGAGVVWTYPAAAPARDGGCLEC